MSERPAEVAAVRRGRTIGTGRSNVLEALGALVRNWGLAQAPPRPRIPVDTVCISIHHVTSAFHHTCTLQQGVGAEQAAQGLTPPQLRPRPSTAMDP